MNPRTAIAVGVGVGKSPGAAAAGGSGPAVVVLPTPPFGSTNLLAWWDAKQSAYIYTDDAGGGSTIAAWEDISGKGIGLLQADKSLQPVLGANGGPYFNAAAQYLSANLTNPINGLSQVSVYCCMRPDVNIGGAKRTVLYISEAAATDSPPGSGSAAARLACYMSSGSTGRRPYLNISASDGTLVATSTSANQSFGPANGAALTDLVTKRRLGWEIDLTPSPATYASYYQAVLDTTQTFTPVDPGPPWAFNTANAVQLRVGNDSGQASGLGMELIALLILGEIPTSGRRAQIDSYLAGL